MTYSESKKIPYVVIHDIEGHHIFQFAYKIYLFVKTQESHLLRVVKRLYMIMIYWYLIVIELVALKLARSNKWSYFHRCYGQFFIPHVTT